MQLLPKETFVKVTFRCKEEFKNSLKNSSCLVHISVGQDYHEGEKFIATMDLVNETFNSCTLVLCDTLQRHSLQMFNPHLAKEDSYVESFELGNQWLIRNEHAFKYLNIPFKLYRWDDWLSDCDYAPLREEIDSLYMNNENYRTAIHSTIEKFLTRNSDLLADPEKYKQAFELSKRYVMEEMPVLIPLWMKTNADFVVYPRARTAAMAATFDHYVKNNNLNILNEVALKFNPRVKPKRLSFSYMDFFEKLEERMPAEVY